YDHFDLEFDVNVPQAQIQYAALGEIAFPDGTSAEYVVAIYSAGPFLSHVYPATTGVASASNWHHAAIKLDRASAGTTYTRTVTIDTTTVETIPGIAQTVGGGTELRFGLFSTDPGTGTDEVLIDNIVFRRR